MYDTQTRIEKVKIRSESIRKRKHDVWIFRLSVLCCILVTNEIYLIYSLQRVGEYHSQEAWLYGTTILFSDIGSHVFVAVLSFVLAVVFTILCVKYQEKNKGKNKSNYKEDDL